MHRQSSRSTTHMDTIECSANTSDLALENEALKREYDQRSKSRRDQQSKRSNEISGHRSTQRSPPSVTRKRHPSPPPMSSSSSSRSQNRHYPSQRFRRPSSPSPSPPPPSQSSSSSRYHRPTRPVVAAKRPHPQSESPGERRPPIHRSRTELQTERTIGDVLTSIPPVEGSKLTPKHEAGDISLVSEDESTRIHDSRSNGAKTNDSPIVTTDNKLHSTPSVPILRPSSNESLLEMSTIPQECELSILAKSTLSTANTSSILTPTINPSSDFMQTIDLINKLQTTQAIPNATRQVEAWSQQILKMIQKQIELQKSELDCRERELKLRERELAEREKRFNVKSSEATSSTTPMNSEPFLITKPNTIEEKTPSKSDVFIDQDIVNVSPEESVVNSIPPAVDTSQATLPNKTLSTQSSVTRKTRFSQMIVDPSIFSSTQKPVLDLYSDDFDAPNELISPAIGADLKITSSSTCRKVEIQSGGGGDKTSTSKGSSHDLRLTLGKNRTKQSSNDEHETNGGEADNDQESAMRNNDGKQQSHDYQQQRSVTSTEPIIDGANDKRDVRRHRQQQYSPSSANNNSNDRPYNHGPIPKYRSHQKRYETDDLRSRFLDPKQAKPSRPPHKNNY